VYEIDVEETLKGATPGAPVRVRAPDYFRGCCVQPNEPPAPALEAGAGRTLLFLDGPAEGAFDVARVVLLDPDQGMSAWFGEGHPARHGPGAVRALVEMNAADAERGAALWAGGLRGKNPLLVDALLDRLASVLAKDGSDYGPLDGARRDLAAGRKEIVEAAVGNCASPVASTRERALACALRAMPLDGPLLARALAAARASSADASRWVRESAIRLLIAADDASAPGAVRASLGCDGEDRYALLASIDLARDLAARRPDSRDGLIAPLLALMERSDLAPAAIGALRRITGRKLETADEWEELRAAHPR
jgi:hypothetical protein